jgi:hypothetical protein
MRRTTISLPDELAERVAREARHRETSAAEVIRTLVEQGLGGAAGGPRALPWVGLFDDPDMVPGEAIDQALAAEWADAIDRDRG